MSPRKSSTSSGKPNPQRPRYLGIEVAGEPFPTPRELERELARRLGSSPGGAPEDLRVIRQHGRRAIVMIPHLLAAAARSRWNETGSARRLRTVRTWGTLVGAKAWIRQNLPGGLPPLPSSRRPDAVGCPDLPARLPRKRRG